MAKLPWKPWHEVVKLRDDLRSGELPLHMFAADLYEVFMQSGKRPVYEKPDEFFALTYPTYNLRQLVRDVVLRVAGKNEKAVRQLELTYGGGKTHTLITLHHLVKEPNKLPELPAVAEFREAVGQPLPKARVTALCFDKLDVEKGMEVRSPDRKVRSLLHPWSVLAYQVAGDEGLRILHAKNKAEERGTAPAENLLVQLLEIPAKENLGVLILIDEVLTYVREKASQDSSWKERLVNFFQYLTQAATKVDRCCVVASLLASDPKKSDSLGSAIAREIYDIFQRQREEAVEPVVKEDVAEVLRRRFFKPESLKDREAFRPHIQAALKGITAVDDATAREGAQAEERFIRSYPFHPDLTEVFYVKWTGLPHFQRARGVLRTFALALREAENWDTSPLVGPSVFLTAPDREGLSESARELVMVADTQDMEGKKQAWTGILVGEFSRSQQIQRESVGIKFREIEQAVVATFLHSQPIGHTAKKQDLSVLLGATRPDKIELDKGLIRWAQVSHWLDDEFTSAIEGQVPETWRLGNRPNLTQMHAVALGRISDDIVKARLLDEISKVKSLTAGASAAGVRVHMLPVKPRDIEDEGQFHYAILGPSAASDSGKLSAEAKKFLDETTGTEKPRVYRNAILLVTPSKDGFELAMARVRDYLAWEQVRAGLKEQEKEGKVDAARLQTLAINIDKARNRIPDAIKQAYCIVVTVSEKNENQAFKVSISDEPHFTIIKADPRSRIQETPITAEALLPGGPYDLWREGEKSRRVKDLAGAFAQFPHLPKMLKTEAIFETLVEGCADGVFVLKLTRPDRSVRAWWRSRPDENALADPSLELVLPEAAELVEIPPELLAPGKLPGLWKGEEIIVQDVFDYFGGTKKVEIQRDGYSEAVQIPKAIGATIEKAIGESVEVGTTWLLSGPASILSEPVPAGLLNAQAKLCVPPSPIAAAEILPENLPSAWRDEQSTALSIATALSQKRGKTLPWKTVSDVISAALRARFVELSEGAGPWPCDYPGAQAVKLKLASGSAGGGTGEGPGGWGKDKRKVARAELEPSEVQELGDVVPSLLDVKAKSNVPLKFIVSIELGDGKESPPEQVIKDVDKILKNVKKDFTLQ